MEPKRSGSVAPPPPASAKVCVVCGAFTEAADVEDTLNTIRAGWRLTRASAPDGSSQMQWRCPTCWVNYRAKAPPSGPRERR